MQLWDSVGIFRPHDQCQIIVGAYEQLSPPEPFSSSLTPTTFTKTFNVIIVEKMTVGEVVCPRYNQLAVNALKTISCRDTYAQISKEYME